MELASKSRIVSLLLKGIVIVSAAVGIVLSYHAAKDVFMSGSRIFMYFTIQSNIAVALLSLIGAAFLLKSRRTGRIWLTVQFVGAVSITLTGAVFTFVLAPTLGEAAWNIQNVLTHEIVPLAAVADFLLSGVHGSIRRSSVFYVVLPPLAYAVYAGIGYIAGWEFSEGISYPYFFLNWGSPAGAFGFSPELPFMGCVWWILALMILLLAVGSLYLLFIARLGKARGKTR